jgi:cell division protein FtsI/penicillin-binding protein 2
VIKSEVQLADSGYGQGEVLMNPLHLAAIFGSFVNGGNIVKPYLTYKDGAKAEFWKEDVYPSSVADTILKILQQVVDNPEGTGHQAYMQGLPLAAKTGTAEIKQNQEDKKGTELGWFEAVNLNDPRLLVLSMVEDVKDRGGSAYVVPKVAEIFKQFVK